MPKRPPTEAFGTNESATVRRFYRLYKITIPLFSDIIFRFIDADFDLDADVSDGTGLQTWSAGPGIEAEDMPSSIDLSVESMNVAVPNTMLEIGSFGSRQIADWARLGLFDDGYVDVYIYDMETTTAMWHNRWSIQGQPAWTYEAVVFSLEPWMARFDVPGPRTIIQEQCNNKLYDQYCGVVRANYSITASVAASPTPTTTVFNFTVASSGSSVPAGLPDNWLALGDLRFLSGALAIVRARMVLTQTGFQVRMVIPYPQAPAAGDSLIVAAGCDKTLATCVSKFDNAIRFRGFPYIPKADAFIG